MKNMIRFAQQRLSIAVVILALAGITCSAATHYVVMPGTVGVTPTDPYTNWTMAGTNIIDVVNAATTNTAPRVIWVTNGTYYPTNEIMVTNAMTLQSVNGRDLTILHGGSAGTNRCITLFNYHMDPVDYVVFDGFTVTNYYHKRSGTVYNSSSNSRRIRILNCLITGNRATNAYGGGLYIYRDVTVTNCILRGNWAGYGGGGAWLGGLDVTWAGCVIENNSADGNGGGLTASSAGYSCITISNCFIINNRCDGSSSGGGIYILAGYSNKIVSCVITGNVSKFQGGGVALFNVDVINSVITGNSTTNSDGGGVWGTNINLRNCLIARNTAKTNAGGVYFASGGTIMNCTVVSNYAGVTGGGLFIINAGGYGTNNIIYHNMAGVSANNFTNTAGNTGLNYSCVIPAVDGTGNITNDPGLKDLNGGNYRLNPNSPCINRGINQDWMTNSYDLDGKQRIRYGTVDMGAYETIYEGTTFSFH